MTQQKKVVEHVSRMIVAMGVKSVRMDDVASSLGMSKRTLYELFGDKEELLYRSVLHLLDDRYKALSEQVSECDNMLEMLLVSVRILTDNGRMDDMEKRMAYNLKKFYPNIYDKVQKAHSERSLAGLQYALDRCLEEGYIDPVVDVELMARLFFLLTGLLTGAMMNEYATPLPDGVSREEAFGAMVINFLRGLSTVKGLKVIDELIAREPRPKTLKQRREEQSLLMTEQTEQE